MDFEKNTNFFLINLFLEICLNILIFKLTQTYVFSCFSYQFKNGKKENFKILPRHSDGQAIFKDEINLFSIHSKIIKV